MEVELVSSSGIWGKFEVGAGRTCPMIYCGDCGTHLTYSREIIMALLKDITRMFMV